MNDMSRLEKLQGRCVLVVEDEYIIAAELAQLLEEAGADVIGPVGTVADALNLIASNRNRIDGALLDINLHGERVYPVADALSEAGVGFVFLSGYDAMLLPKTYERVPRCEKPVDWVQLAIKLSGQI